jgi:hypothetical protein
MSKPNRVWSARYYEGTWPYIGEGYKKPADLDPVKVQNGRLPNDLLASVSIESISKKVWKEYKHTGDPGKYTCYKGHKLAVAAMELMIRAAASDGITIRVESCYRPYEEQLHTFNERYSLTKPDEKKWLKEAKKGGDTAHRRLNDYDKRFNGKTYWLKKGNGTPCATPGQSNHGWGLAFDLEFAEAGTVAKQEQAIDWVRRNSFAFGFYWDVGNPNAPGFENWHLTYSFGNSYGCLPLFDNSINFLPTTPKSYIKKTPASKKVIKNKSLAQPATKIVTTPASQVVVTPDAIPRIPQMVVTANC